MFCWLAATFALDKCDGPIDQAHIGLTEHFLHKAPNGPKLTKEEANDPRLLRPACRKHHAAFDGRGQAEKLTREDIPPSVEKFAEEYGVTWRLDRDFGPRKRLSFFDEHEFGKVFWKS